jgi:hypothetical protein
MLEAEILRQGKDFHQRVQSDWERTAKGEIHKEHGIVFGIDPKKTTYIRRGRIDLFVDKIGEFVAVIERARGLAFDSGQSLIFNK